MEAFRHNFKVCMAIIGILVIFFLPPYAAYKMSRISNLDEINSLKYRIKSLEYYKAACIKKTKEQHVKNRQIKPIIKWYSKNKEYIQGSFTNPDSEYGE